jgi:phage shock protein A
MEQPQNQINPDDICNQALQAKMQVYRAKEGFETVLKNYNDQVDQLINLVNLMKNRILAVESELEKVRTEQKVSEDKKEKVPEKVKA